MVIADWHQGFAWNLLEAPDPRIRVALQRHQGFPAPHVENFYQSVFACGRDQIIWQNFYSKDRGLMRARDRQDLSAFFEIRDPYWLIVRAADRKLVIVQ